MIVPDLHSNLVEIINGLGPRWAESVALLLDLIKEEAPDKVWFELGMVVIRAEIDRAVADPLLDPERWHRSEQVIITYRERTAVAAKWMLDEGRRLDIRSADDLLCALALFRRHLGLGSRVSTRNVSMALPKREKEADSGRYREFARNKQDEIEERFRNMRKNDGLS